MISIRKANKADANAIRDIYNWYIKNTIITFETEEIDQKEIENRIQNVMSKYDWLVALEDNVIVGYAYYGQFRARAAYNHTVETAIYLRHDLIGKGTGHFLYDALFQSAKEKGYKEFIGVISVPNPESVKFHQKWDFKEVGYLTKVGYKFDEYIDICLMQKSL
jgi:phosphinothricin acetyltransferase